MRVEGENSNRFNYKLRQITQMTKLIRLIKYEVVEVRTGISYLLIGFKRKISLSYCGV